MDKKDKGPLSWLKNVLSSDGNEKKQGMDVERIEENL